MGWKEGVSPEGETYCPVRRRRSAAENDCGWSVPPAGAKELTVAARREEPGKESSAGLYTEYGLLQVFIYQMGAGTPNSGLRYINKCYEFRAVSGFGCPDICYENIKEGMIVQGYYYKPGRNIIPKRLKKRRIDL